MRLPRVLLLVLVGLLLAGCGGDRDDGTTTSSAGAAAGAFPVTVTHARGSTTIEQEPRRVVAVGLRDQDTLLALGIKAVGAMDWFGQGTFAKWPWEDWGGAPPKVVSTGGFDIDFERVAAARPDLILGVYQDLKKGDYDKLTKIAPTVAQSAKHKPYTMPWREETREIARAVGRTQQAEALIAKVDARFAQVRKEHPEFRGKTAAMVDPSGTNTFVFGSTDPRGQFLEELGFAPSAPIERAVKGEFGTEISDERLDLLDVDHLFVLADRNTRGKLLSKPLFRRLDVAKEGRVVELPYYDAPQYGAAVAFNTVLSIPYGIDGVLKQMAASTRTR
ncbi:iron-siderophore ABC transporter substrate-binding protein [Patulibacter sp. SYSU D01012]|uniref:iron-siderophore ABC transporter substrate-binding protein n=1 Tax=Patulibacter sp. SYSU D01012 TaxID=2817381 RepID=UPI001B3003C9|nr:iron-siderophore ABC transporter substrate-binding protein [Patulibacter sp. SYSU D01012]